MTAPAAIVKKEPRRRAAAGDFDAKHPRDIDGQFKDKPNAAETAFKARHPKTRFKLDGMNRRQRKAVMESFDSFANEFPGTARKVAFVAADPGLGGVGQAFAKRTNRGGIRFGILLKPNHSTKGAHQMDSLMNRTVAAQKRDTDPMGVALTHELGHALAFHGEAEIYARRGQRLPANVGSNRINALVRATQDPIVTELGRAHRRSRQDYRDWSTLPPTERKNAPRPIASDYAAENPAEFFAENFAARRHPNIYAARAGQSIPARATHHPDTASWEERYRMLADRYDTIESQGKLRKGLTEDITATGWEPICSGIPEGGNVTKAAGDLHLNGPVDLAPKRKRRSRKAAAVAEALGKEAKRYPKGNPKGGKFMPGKGGAAAAPAPSGGPAAPPKPTPKPKKEALKVDAAAAAAAKAGDATQPGPKPKPQGQRAGGIAAGLVQDPTKPRLERPEKPEPERMLELLRKPPDPERKKLAPRSGPAEGPSIMAKAQRRYPRGHPEGGKFMPGGRGVAAPPRTKAASAQRRRGMSRKKKLALAALGAAAGYSAVNAKRKTDNRRTNPLKTNRIGIEARRAGRFAAHDTLRAAKLSMSDEDYSRGMAEAGRKLRQANAHTRAVRQDAVRAGGRKAGTKDLPKRVNVRNPGNGRNFSAVTRDGWAYRVAELRRKEKRERRTGGGLFGPVRKRGSAPGVKRGSGAAHLQRRYPSGHPKGGQFIPGGGKGDKGGSKRPSRSKVSRAKRLAVNAAYAAAIGGSVVAAAAEHHASRNRMPKEDKIKALSATTPARRRARFAAHDMLRDLRSTSDKAAYDRKVRNVALALRQTNTWTQRDARERKRLGLAEPGRPYSRGTAVRGGYAARAAKEPTRLSYGGAAVLREGGELPKPKRRTKASEETKVAPKRTTKPKIETPDKPKRTRRKPGGEVTKQRIIEALVIEKKGVGGGNPNQPRRPKGTPGGGQFAPKNGGGKPGAVLDPVVRKPKKKRPPKQKPEADNEEEGGKKKELTRAEKIEAQQWAVRRNVARTAALGSIAMLGTAVARGSRFNADRPHLEARFGLGVRNMGLRLNYRPKGYGSKTWGRSNLVSSKRLGDIQLDDRSGQARAVYFRIGNPLRKQRAALIAEILKHPGHADQSVHGHRLGLDPGRSTVGRKPGGRTASIVQGHDRAGRYTRDSARARRNRRMKRLAAAGAVALALGSAGAGAKVQQRRSMRGVNRATVWNQRKVDAEAKKIAVLLGTKGGVKPRRGKNGKYLPG